MTASRKPRRTLTPVDPDKTKRFRSFTSGRVEDWELTSRDGVWLFERLEVTGTPWQVTHLPTRTQGDYYGNKTAARAATADGSALACVERVISHQRGEHAERNPSCIMC
jgi:hypothetical protein